MSAENHSIPVSVGKAATKAGDGPGAATRAATEGPQTEAQIFHTPLIDIHESPDGLILEADLPGVTEKTLTIQLEDHVLSLHGHVPSPVPSDARTLHEEYRPGDFYRSFILSDEVERDRISAELKQGVLRLVLPKADRARTRRIEI